MDVAKIDLDKKRDRFRALLDTVDAYLDTISTKIKDSKGVGRDVFYVDENVVGAVGHGDRHNTVIVESNDFDVDLLLLKGEIKIVIDEMTEHILKGRKKHLFIPKNTPFTMEGLGDKNAIIQRTEK